MQTAPQLHIGQIINYTYELIELLGEGGMGQTFRARNIALDQDVAIKVLSNTKLGETGRKLFLREAQVLRGVSEDGIVRYETAFMDAQGRLFLVMEYLQGKPLSYYLSQGARLQPRDCLKLGLRLARALSKIHALGIIHRDFAPDNLMVPNETIDKATIIDFGVAANRLSEETTLIGEAFVGKFNYASPEQLGLFGQQITPKSDLYALGLILMKTLGLTVPGEGLGIGVIDHRRQDIVLPPHVPSALRHSIERLLRANPADRPEDAVGIFEAALAEFDRPEMIQGGHVSVEDDFNEMRLRWARPLLAVIFLFIGFVTLKILMHEEDTRQVAIQDDIALESEQFAVRDAVPLQPPPPPPPPKSTVQLPQRPLPNEPVFPRPPKAGEPVEHLQPRMRPSGFEDVVRLITLLDIAYDPYWRTIEVILPGNRFERDAEKMLSIPGVEQIIESLIVAGARVSYQGNSSDVLISPTRYKDPRFPTLSPVAGGAYINQILAQQLQITNRWDPVMVRLRSEVAGKGTLEFPVNIIEVIEDDFGFPEMILPADDAYNLYNFQNETYFTADQWGKPSTRMSDPPEWMVIAESLMHVDGIVANLRDRGILTAPHHETTSFLQVLSVQNIDNVAALGAEIDVLKARLGRQ